MPGSETIPTFLRGYEAQHERDPRQATRSWFRDARFGLFITYGLYSLVGRDAWLMYHEKIHVAEDDRLADRFTAERFDAEAIADLALDAGMRYVTLVTRHHDSFCLFASEQTDFHSVNTPAGRDLVGELAEACAKRGLGLFLYYGYGVDWRHPYALSNDVGVPCARPPYDEPEPTYRYRTERDFRHYIDFMHGQLRELLTRYGPVAGVWLDLITPCYFRTDLYPVDETYRLIRALQPHCLIAFKQGATGDEDFMSQEMQFVPLEDRLRRMGAPPEVIERANRAWQMNRPKWNEVCTTLQDRGWGYVEGARHIDADEVMARLGYAAAQRCNLLLNTGPLPDGSIHPEDAETLAEVGRRIRRDGYPEQGPMPDDPRFDQGAVGV